MRFYCKLEPGASGSAENIPTIGGGYAAADAIAARCLDEAEGDAARALALADALVVGRHARRHVAALLRNFRKS
jgi:hypothetical protein